MNTLEYSKLDGVKDLPIKVRGPFAQALKAEDEGDHTKAEGKLHFAIAQENQINKIP